MAKYLSFGHFNKKYFFILGSITVRIIVIFITGFTPYLTPNNTYFLFGFNSNIFSHPIITYCLQYISLCLGGLILELIFNNKNNNKNHKKEINSGIKTAIELSKIRNRNLTVYKYLLNENDIEIKKNGTKDFLKIFIVFSLYYFAKISLTSLDNLGFNRVKYWPLEFIFLLIFSKKILNRVLYKHQQLSLYILLFLCTTIYVINSFIALSDQDCSLLSGEKLEECKMINRNIYSDINYKLGWYFIPIIILLYLAAMASNAYSSIITKWFMDIKYITLNRILIYIGIIGLFYSLILFFIFSKIPCSKDDSIIIYVCKLDYQGDLFYDTYKTFGDIEINSNFYIDVFAQVPIYIVSSFLIIFFEFLIIKDLDPFYLIPIDCIYFLLYDIIDYCMTYQITHLNRNLKFICQVCSNTIAVFLCAIHLEIIELHFCKLDLYLKRNIIRRTEAEKFDVLDDINEINESDSVLSSDKLSCGLAPSI